MSSCPVGSFHGGTSRHGSQGSKCCLSLKGGRRFKTCDLKRSKVRLNIPTNVRPTSGTNDLEVVYHCFPYALFLHRLLCLSLSSHRLHGELPFFVSLYLFLNLSCLILFCLNYSSNLIIFFVPNLSQILFFFALSGLELDFRERGWCCTPK